MHVGACGALLHDGCIIYGKFSASINRDLDMCGSHRMPVL